MIAWLLTWGRRLLYLPDGGSTFADGIDLLHLFVITATMLVSAYVFAMAAIFTIRWRRRTKGQLTEPLHATRLHEAFTIGVVTTTFVLWWVLGYAQYVSMTEPPKGAQTVYLEAKQWMWKFTYEDGSASNDVLTVPVGKPVKLVMSSRDVIHSFYVPSFRLKQDVVPGRYVTTWFEANAPGRYPIWCAEYCGVSHSLMRGEVVVLSPEEYATWKKGRTPAGTIADCGRGPGSCGRADLVTLGREVAQKRGCVACHTFDGQRHVGPSWRGLFGSERVFEGGRRGVADEAYLTRSMMEPLGEVVAGYPPVMPTYQGQLTAPETGALVELIKSLAEPAAPATPGVTLPSLVVTPAPDAGAGGGTP